MGGFTFKPMVYTPHIKGQMFSQMAEDDLQLGESIKDAVGDHAEDMKAHTLSKAERWSYEPLSLRPKFVVYDVSWIARVQIEGNIQLGNHCPKFIPLGLVIEYHTVWTSSLGVVDQSSLETILMYTATQFRGCFFRTVHG